jgi:hypothetical protein
MIAQATRTQPGLRYKHARSHRLLPQGARPSLCIRTGASHTPHGMKWLNRAT